MLSNIAFLPFSPLFLLLHWTTTIFRMRAKNERGRVGGERKRSGRRRFRSFIATRGLLAFPFLSFAFPPFLPSHPPPLSPFPPSVRIDALKAGGKCRPTQKGPFPASRLPPLNSNRTHPRLRGQQLRPRRRRPPWGTTLPPPPPPPRHPIRRQMHKQHPLTKAHQKVQGEEEEKEEREGRLVAVAMVP